AEDPMAERDARFIRETGPALTDGPENTKGPRTKGPWGIAGAGFGGVAVRCSGLDGAGLRRLADLCQKRHDVDELPLLRDLAVAASADRETRHLDIVVGHVVPTECEPRGDELALGELVVDRDAQAINGFPVALDHLGQTVGAADAVGMKQVVVGDQTRKRIEV